MTNPAQIVILRTGNGSAFEFLVEVRDADGKSRHDVTLDHDTYRRLSAEKYAPETCVEAAFRFLLEREPKNAILSNFKVEQISTYFPEFEQALPKYFPTV
jgi:hypothetical protein